MMPSDGTESHSAGSTSISLLERLRTHDSEAWRRVINLYGPLIYYWCRQSGLEPADAADVGQDVFRAVARKIATFRHDRPGDTFRGWLRTITWSKIQDHRRREAAEPRGAGGSEAQLRIQQVPAQDGTPDPASSAVPDARGGLFARALELVRSEFEDRTWQAFWRVVVEDRWPADVAAELGMTAVAVRKAKSRVLRRLREELGELME